jgi:aspartate racemase
LRLDPDDRVLQFASLNWDASLEEIVPCLLSGATLVLRAPAMTDSYGAFLRHCRSLAITVLTLPTSFWHGLTDEILRDGSGLPECVRLVNIGGEPVSARRVREWKSRVPANVRLVNTYGLTESTAVSTMCDLSRVALDEREPTAPIGHPIANCRAYVLNPMLQPVPDGVEGELCIAGACLARGYLNDPRLNAEKFVPDPFSSDPEARLLRTGDLVRRRPQVGLIHLGRMDEQVKVRGIRIEPAEIEACLCRHPAVRSAAVLVREVPDGGDHQLVAYVVPTTAERDSPIGPSLRQHLRERLPEYMVPSVFVPMDRLPLTSTGKTDRRALPAPRPAHLDDMPVEASPRNSLEMQLATVWEATLGIRPVGIHDDFFELGGDSLLAVRLFSAIERTTGIQAPLALLFEAPTVSGLAGRIQRSEGQAEAGSLVAIQIGGSRPPLFCVHWLGGNVLVYRDLAIHLGPDQPVFGLQARGLGGSEPPHTRIEDMAQHYVKEILRRQPDGPYFLAGASMGGKVAFEMAQQLRAMGREVALVALFDTRGEMDPPSVPLESRVRLHAAQLRGRGAMDMALYLAKRVRARLRRAAIAVFIRAGLPLPRSLWDLKEITYRAARNYHPRFYPGRVILFRASERDPESDPFLGWDPVAGGGIAVHEVPGNHVTLLKEPGVRLLAEELRRRMAGSGAAGAED